MGVCYCPICRIAVSYRAACRIVTLYRAICRLRISYGAICRRGFFYRAICNGKLQDSSFSLCNLHDRNFLKGNLVYGYVAEARSSFRRFYLWWFRNLACGDLIGNNWIQNEQVDVPLGLVWGEAMVWLSVCGLQWSSNIFGESERRPTFDIFQVCSTLIVGGG